MLVESTDAEPADCTALLYRGLEHLQIFAFANGSWNQSPHPDTEDQLYMVLPISDSLLTWVHAHMCIQPTFLLLNMKPNDPLSSCILYRTILPRRMVRLLVSIFHLPFLFNLLPCPPTPTHARRPLWPVPLMTYWWPHIRDPLSLISLTTVS